MHLQVGFGERLVGMDVMVPDTGLARCCQVREDNHPLLLHLECGMDHSGQDRLQGRESCGNAVPGPLEDSGEVGQLRVMGWGQEELRMALRDPVFMSAWVGCPVTLKPHHRKKHLKTYLR